VSGFSRTERADPKVRLKADTTDRRVVGTDPALDYAERKRHAAEQKKREQTAKKFQSKISALESKIAEREQAMKDIEAAMSAPGFYDNRDQAQPLINRHQTLMWELGELMHEWEELSKAEN
jgi:predicted  nucleic acid-binding Zn-ribbon protein